MATKEGLRRIKPDAVPAVFAAFGLKPAINRWGGDDCCCLAILMLAEAHGRDDAIRVARRWEAHRFWRVGNATYKLRRWTGVSEDYLLGIIYGFDAGEFTAASAMGNKDREFVQLAGYADGLAARGACMAAGLEFVTDGAVMVFGAIPAGYELGGTGI